MYRKAQKATLALLTGGLARCGYYLTLLISYEGGITHCYDMYKYRRSDGVVRSEDIIL